VVGFRMPYQVAPCHRAAGKSLTAERTVWGKVSGHYAGYAGVLLIDDIHDVSRDVVPWVIPAASIHVAMPEGYDHG